MTPPAHMTVFVERRSVGPSTLRFTPSRSTSVTIAPILVCTPSFARDRSAFFARSSGKVGSSRGASIQQNDLRVCRVYGTKVVPERLPRDFADGPCQFDPGRPCSHDHETEPGAPLSGIGSTLCNFKCVQNLVPDGGRFLHALQTRSPLLPPHRGRSKSFASLPPRSGSRIRNSRHRRAARASRLDQCPATSPSRTRVFF